MGGSGRISPTRGTTKVGLEKNIPKIGVNIFPRPLVGLKGAGGGGNPPTESPGRRRPTFGSRTPEEEEQERREVMLQQYLEKGFTAGRPPAAAAAAVVQEGFLHNYIPPGPHLQPPF